jgi:hypothetical protein
LPLGLVGLTRPSCAVCVCDVSASACDVCGRVMCVRVVSCVLCGSEQAQKAIDQGRQSSEKLEISHARLELISVELDKQSQVSLSLSLSRSLSTTQPACS